MNKEERISLLLKKMDEQTISEAELEELTAVLGESDAAETLITSQLQSGSADTPLPSQQRQQQMMAEILSADRLPEDQTTATRGTLISLYKKIAVAAAILIIAGVSFWLMRKSTSSKNTTDIVSVQQHDKEPGTDIATLTLADGTVIPLDSATQGKIALQGKTAVTCLNRGELKYSSAGQSDTGTYFNTVRVPRGGTYVLVLADGTRVWLNAASSLKYPADFTGNFREVELTGEGYFEVTENAAKPFMVQSGNLKIQVLGTSFNLNTYEEEAVAKASLIDGSVKVITGTGSAILKPGQQASISRSTQNISVGNFDTEEVIAWKNGFFQFNKIDESYLRQLSRWYDVDLQFEAPVKSNEFNGRITRQTKLSSIVDAFNISGIPCRIEKNKLVILP
ncbi:DUF4974 domain-containing protein [Pseudoflavitalea sp. G-6-1-2]|uniref:FecR family protein n=1 Tax=Pseudoflavitalea sp. G-6-1-2 TaxID=2728841 RepID=UPI001469BF02|nr:FecR family protein [Pseudoflavitalea sp. G-6-1-2]NML21975.1 DUF4974 domain-containing protein [Pseudoflavitalea sp. G-6-1-2]